MNEWKEYRFDKFVNVNPKVVFSKKENIPFVEMKDIDASNKFCTNSTYRNLSGGSRFENGDTLFARITPCLENGKIAQVRNLTDGKGLGSTEFHVLRGRPDISLSDFVYYLSRWNEVRDFAEINLHGTSGRQRFPADAFKELVLNLPGITEQKSIAEVLSSLDDKIDLLHRQNKTLEQMAETLFRQWLLDFDRTTTLAEYIKVQSGYAFKSKDFLETGTFGIVKITNISFDSIDIENTQFVSESLALSINDKFYIKPGSFLIAMTGAEIGKIGIVGINTKNLLLNQRVGMLVDKLEHSSVIGYMFLKSKEGQDHIINTASGSAQPNISTYGIEEMEVPFKSESEQVKIIDQLSPLFEKKKRNLFSIKLLRDIRDLLLPKLMIGTIHVNNG